METKDQTFDIVTLESWQDDLGGIGDMTSAVGGGSCNSNCTNNNATGDDEAV